MLSTSTEKCWRVNQIAKQLEVSRDTVSRMVEDEPGVIVIERPATKTKRRFRMILVPDSVLKRIVARMTR